MPASPKIFSKKYLLWTLGLAITAVLLTVATFFVGKRFAGEILNEVIKRETNGFYGLTFQSIDFDILNRRFKVNELILTVDTTKDLESLGIRNAYDVSLQELIIDLESLGEFYLNKELLMKNVQVIDPDIQMVPIGPPQKKETFSFQAGNMYQAISDYLKVLKIDYFRIQEGKLEYGGNQFTLGNIDFLVRNLLMDSVSRSNNVFYSETIRLEVSNQKFHLPDSIHEVTFDRFLLSTKDSILSFENLRVRPTEISGVQFAGENEFNVYDIHVPKLSFKGLDYVSAYQKNHLIIDELIMDEPTVFVDDETHASAKNKEADNSLLNLLFQVFDAVDIGKLSVNQAHVDLKANAGPKSQRFKAEESDIVFYNIRLDTSNFRFNSRNKYFDDLQLNIHNYTYMLPDSVHTVRFERLSVNTFESEIRLDSVVVTHERAGNEASVLVDVIVPELSLRNVDYQRAITAGVLNMGTLDVSDVMVKVRSTGARKDRKALSVDDLYLSMRPVFREVTMDQLNLDNVSLSLPNGINFGQIDLSFDGIRFNTTTGRISNLYNNADLSISNFVFDQDSIRLSGARLHSDHSLATYHFIDWNVDINTRNTSVNGSFDSLQITGMNVDSLLLENFNTFRRAVLTNPDIRFSLSTQKDSTEESKGVALGIEKELIIVGGRVEGNIDSTRLAAKNINADVFLGDSTAFRRLSVEDVLVRAATENHWIKVGVWSFDTLDGHMYFKNLKIDPISKNDTAKARIRLDIPLLSLMDFQQAEFFDNNHLYASDILVQNPNVKIEYLPKQQPADSTAAKKPFSMALGRFKIKDGNFSARTLAKTLDFLQVRRINATMYGVNYPQESPFEDDDYLYSDSVLFEIGKVLPYFTSGDTLQFSRIQFDSNRENLTVDSIKFAKTDNSLSLLLPITHLKNLDVRSLYRDKVIILDTLEVERVSGFNFKKEKSGEQKPFSQPLSIGHLGISDVNWVYKDSSSGKEVAFNNVNIKSDGLNLRDTFQLEKIPDYMKTLSLEGGPFEIPASKDYRIRLDKYLFSYPESTVELAGFKLLPERSKEEYSANLEKQNDWFDVSIEQISVSKVDVVRAVRDQNYIVKKIELKGIDALIYRDKSVPFPEDQVRSLPQADLKAIQERFRIDTLLIKGRVRYQEKPKDYATYGEISFDDLDGRLLNITNLDISSNDIMKLEATGKLMNAGSFEVSSNFFMDDPDNQFTFRGRVLDFPLDSMNRMLGPVANINIKSGFSEELFFDFVANDSLARGEMRFRYDDLKVQILNKQTHDTHGLGQGIKTFFANTFVVKNKNPSFLVFVRKGVIFQQRDTSRAVFNYWGKALLSGAVSSIGIHKSDKAAKRFERKVEVE